MNSELALCRHLVSPELATLAIAPDDVLEWYDGPVSGVLRCGACGAAALVVMLDWCPQSSVRVYAVAAVEVAAYELFVRNRERGSCDAGRLANELLALWTTTGSVERWIAVDSRTHEVKANVASSRATGVPVDPWIERLPAEGDTRWFDRVGLTKSATRSR